MSIDIPYTLTYQKRFFIEPKHPKHRQYEALRAFYVENRPSADVARDFGYSPGAFRVLCHDFTHTPEPSFFLQTRPGPHFQPKKSAAREIIISLRKQNHSIYEISQALKEQKLSLSAAAVNEVLRAEGFAPLPRRRDDERPQTPHPTIEAVADAREFSLAPRQFFTSCGGLFLFLPDLARLSVDSLAESAPLPGAQMIPPTHALRAYLTLQL